MRNRDSLVIDGGSLTISGGSLVIGASDKERQLLKAVKIADLKKVQQLIKTGASFEYDSKEGMALKEGQYEIARHFISMGAD